MSLKYTPVTKSIRVPRLLKQGQGHQTCYELVDQKQGYNNAKFEKPHLNSVCEKANDKDLVKSGIMSIMSHEYFRKSKTGIFMICLMYLTILRFNLIIG